MGTDAKLLLQFRRHLSHYDRWNGEFYDEQVDTWSSSTDEPGRPVAPPGPATSAACGELVAGTGVTLRWPDGETTEGIASGVTGLGPANQEYVL